MSDTHIEPLDYIYGVKVVDIGDARIKRGKSRRPIGTCAHKNMHYDQEERRVWCADCESNIEAFDAFTILVENFDRQIKRLQDRESKIIEAEATTLVSRAARVMDAEWRKHKTAPLCPHCSTALLPQDILRGLKVRARTLTIAE